jgi:hypothetical protein
MKYSSNVRHTECMEDVLNAFNILVFENPMGGREETV